MSDESRVRVRPEFIEKVGRLEKAAEELIKDVRNRNELLPIDEFRCPYMRELEHAWKDLAIS